MQKYAGPTEIKNILMTNVNGSGDDVMLFTTLDAETLRAAYSNTNVTYEELYEVAEEDLQYYLYEPCWLTTKEEAVAARMAKKQGENFFNIAHTT